MIASRLQIVVNASHKAGFSTIGAFLFALFTEYEGKYAGHASLAHRISAFIRNSMHLPQHTTEPAPINVTPTTALTCDSVSSGVPKTMPTDPWLGVTIALLALLHLRYTYAIIFPTIVGIFLFMCNANRDIISMLSRMGMSIAYSTILSSLHVLASDADTQLRAFGASLDTTAPAFQIFDNVNKMRRTWQQSLGHRDELKSGTAATLVKLEDVTPGALEVEPLLQNIAKKERKNLTVDILQCDVDWSNLRGIGSATVLRAWLKHIPRLARFRTTVEDLFATTYAKHPLRLRKSEVHSMRSTDIDEPTTRGAKKSAV
ncbi:hypothetical protein EV421DRAFT_954803 [Armillaria borealis]|uniref:DUF6589 domain-containing protein n=1 Tax=Armillaria borealis TaxID=47425 RepID=A0AA39MLT8_9AGAR|nr:hypothetical protein EV421DRAFT_954803 [Armillaria borealis]